MSRVGYLAVAAAAVLWAVGGSVASRLIDRGASVVELTAARSWLSALGFAALVWLQRDRRAPRPDVRARELWPRVTAFGLAIAGANFFYYTSLSRLPVAVAITTQYTAPGVVVLWAALTRRERPSRAVFGALAIAFAGVGLLAELPRFLTDQDARLSGIGMLAALGSAVSFATYMIHGEWLSRRIETGRSLLGGFLVSSALWAVVVAAGGRPETLLDRSFAGWIVFLAVATTLVPFFLFVWGLRSVSASRASIVATLEPLAAAVLAWFWLGQRLSVLQLAGAAMVLAGIGVVQAERPDAPEVLTERAALE